MSLSLVGFKPLKSEDHVQALAIVTLVVVVEWLGLNLSVFQAVFDGVFAGLFLYCAKVVSKLTYDGIPSVWLAVLSSVCSVLVLGLLYHWLN